MADFLKCVVSYYVFTNLLNYLFRVLLGPIILLLLKLFLVLLELQLKLLRLNLVGVVWH